MTPLVTTLVFFGGLMLLMVAGTPLGFAAGSLGVLIVFINFGPDTIALASKTIYGLATDQVLVSVPMFVLMAALLERSDVAKDLYFSLQRLTGQLRGGVAGVTLLSSVILAAMSGIIGGEIVLLGLVALPQMLRLKYNRYLAIGTICAGGSLGTMIPPSIVLIIYGLVAEASVRDLFVAAVVPGFMLALGYFVYIVVRCTINPSLAPPVSDEMREEIGVKQTILGLVPPLALISLIMICIYGGITSVTEAAGIGVTGAICILIVRGELNLALFNESLLRTFKTTGILLWVTFGVSVLVSAYNLSGGRDFVSDFILGLDFAPLATIAVMMLAFLILGTFMDWIGIVFLTMPIFVPIIEDMGYDPVWFGILFAINMQVAFLSPPFGPAAFYLKSVAPKSITLPMIYHSLWPFMLIQMVVLGLVMLYPQLTLWLPSL